MPLSDRERRIIASLEKELGVATVDLERVPVSNSRRHRGLVATVVGVLAACGGVVLGVLGAPAYPALAIVPLGLAAATWGALVVVPARLARRRHSAPAARAD